MTPERRRTIESLFDDALDLPPSERASFLDDACSGDAALRADVQRLLDAYTDAPSFLDARAAQVGRDVADELQQVPDRRGERVGPYRLNNRLAEGGMSVVYRAERVDGSFDQTVALKLLPGHFDTEERIGRFRAERQILAGLSHPNIARLLDGGLTTDGYPYLAMEYVDGQPITAFAEAEELDLPGRLSLLQDVLGALQFAHKNLIVHRDIKPDNIFVTGDGEVKLLDFGIAKLLDQPKDVPFTLPLTRTGQRLMTPEYAAPEQVTGDTVTTATDVYQVGVLAYELLTGVRPFDLRGKTPSQIEQIVAEEAPERPSTAVQQTGKVESMPAATPVSGELTGELDAIILKALSKEPDRRYASVEAFAEDIQRFLDGRPVKARTPTVRYRARKFVSRHRWPVTTAGVVSLVIVGFVIALIAQRNIAIEERDRYQQELATSEAVTGYLTELFAASNPRETQGDTLTAFELLDQGVTSIDALDGESRVQTRLMEVMAASYTQIGSYDAADDLLTRTLELTREASGEQSAATASVLANLAALRSDQGDARAADSLYRAALTIKREQLADDHPDLSRSVNGLATIRSREGDLEEAEALYREALALRRATHGERHEHVAATMRNLGILLGRQDELDEAVELMEEALTIEREVLGENHLQVAETATSLAAGYSQQGDNAAAQTLLEDALAIKTQTLGDDHPDLLATLNNLGVITERLGDYATADSLYHRTLDLAIATYGPDHPAVAMTTSNRGTLARRQSDYETALAHYRDALELQEKIYDGEHPAIAGQLKNVAHALHGLERTDEAEAYFLDALDHAEEVFGIDSPRMEEFLRDTARFYEAHADSAAAAPYRARLE